MALKTQQEITAEYINNIKALNPEANPEAIGTDWWVKANIQGGVLSGVYQDNYNLRQATFIQNASGSLLDYYLASYNLTPRLAATPATGYATIPIAPSSTITIPAGTQLTLGNSVYLTTETIAATSLSYNMLIPIQSQATGTGTGLYNGTEINFSTALANINYLVINSMNDGAAMENDSNVRFRILAALQKPKTGGSETDYFNWAISQPNITYAFFQTANVVSLQQLNTYFMSGTGDIDVILETVPPGSYSRSSTSTDITNAGNYINSVKPLFDTVVYNTVYTYIVNDSLDFNITNLTLIPGVSLATILPGFTITVEELIKRELRRGVLSTPLAGVQKNSSYYMILGNIQKTINQSLNSIDGIYAKVVISFNLDFNGSTNDILLPSTANVDGAYPAVYDCNFTNIIIS